MRAILGAMTAVGLALAATAGDDKPKVGPIPLELRIVGKKTTYPLDLGRKTPAEYRKELEVAAKGGGGVPPAPAVDLVVEVRNTSDGPVKLWTRGDPVDLSLELKGKGAVNIAPPMAFTREFRAPVEVELPPGKAVEIPLKSLASGFRMQAKRAYWTEPGEYELAATLKTAVSPAPKGAKDAGGGFGVVKLTGPPIKLAVEPMK